MEADYLKENTIKKDTGMEQLELENMGTLCSDKVGQSQLKNTTGIRIPGRYS